MADIVTTEQLQNASLDVQTLETFVNGTETQVNKPRLIPTVDVGSIAELRKKVQDKVDLQIATLPAGRKGYPTLVSAQAAQATLAANTLVEVTNDTKASNNGVYLWDGTALTKSAYDPALQAKEYIESEFIIPPSEVIGDIVEGEFLAEKPGGVVLYDKANSNSSISLIFPVEADTDYTIKKELSDRFRVAEFDSYPYVGLAATAIHLQSTDKPTVIVDSDGVETQQVSFTTNSVAKYVVVYVTSIGEAPKVSLRKGGSFELNESSVRFRKDVVFGDAKLSNVSLIKKGKNLFKNEDYLEGNITLIGPLGKGRSIDISQTATNGNTAILKIEPDTTYTVSKSASDRFRIGISDSYPRLGAGMIEILAGEENDRATEFTFTSRSTTHYLVLYLSFNSAEPREVQVELGDVATPYESYGYKLFPEAKSKESTTASAVYDYAGVGDANYISKDSATAGAWKDSQYTIPATDDTDTLQALFDSAKGVVSLEPGKKYKVTRPITYNPERVKLIKGNMAHIVCIGDIETFQMVGTLSSSANAKDMNRSLAYNQMSPMVVALKITNPMEVLGTAFVVNKVMSPIFLACNFAYLRRGIVFRGKNRNAILNSNHIYACSDYGIHFEEGGDLHQINIVGNHISYCRKNIFSENHNIYNIQITGGDIETSSYPTLEIGGAAECDMHFLQTTAVLEDLEIVGNTIEDHWNTKVMIKLEGSTTSTNNISCVTISGNVTGNSAGSVIEIGGASGVEIVGQFKANRGYVVDVIGNLDGFKLSTQSKQDGGGLFRAVGGYSLKDVTVCGNNLSNSVTQNPILVDVQSLDNCNFSDNDLRVSGVGGFHTTHKAPITIHADTMKLVRVDDNTIANTSSTTKAVEVVARNSSEKGSMRGNMASYGAFTAPESFAISENA